MTQTTTARETARQMVIDSVSEAARKSHERNFEKLHVRRDGTVSWFESINQSDDLIDSEADGFAAIQSVITVGTGGYGCNCDHCNDIGKVIDGEVLSSAEAIGNAVGDADLDYTEADMLRKLDEIPVGYFNDERD